MRNYSHVQSKLVCCCYRKQAADGITLCLHVLADCKENKRKITSQQITYTNTANHQDFKKFNAVLWILSVFILSPFAPVTLCRTDPQQNAFSLCSLYQQTCGWVTSVSETHSRLKIFERLGEDDVEDCVRPTALLVHVGGSNRPGLVSL